MSLRSGGRIMTSYKLMNLPDGTPAEQVQIVSDENITSIIPFDENNTDYIEYKAWLAKGNTPEAAD